MKRIFYPLAVLALAGCTTTWQDESAVQTYRPAGAEELWRITGQLDNTMKEGLVKTTVDRNLTVTINGDTAAQGLISWDGNGRIDGAYQDRAVEADCNGRRVSPNWVDIRCMILVDNERAATLTF
jgi:hypothetical protein